MGFLYALVALGLSIIWGLMEMINFAHGEFLMLGMFGAWWLSADFGLDPLLAIVPVALVMYLFGMLVYQHLMRRVQGGDPFTQIFATIGLLFLLQNGVNVPAALDLADRGYGLQTGRVVLEGPSDELRGSDLVRKAYLGM